jgi:hypothetical protein
MVGRSREDQAGGERYGRGGGWFGKGVDHHWVV